MLALTMSPGLCSRRSRSAQPSLLLAQRVYYGLINFLQILAVHAIVAVAVLKIRIGGAYLPQQFPLLRLEQSPARIRAEAAGIDPRFEQVQLREQADHLIFGHQHGGRGRLLGALAGR